MDQDKHVQSFLCLLAPQHCCRNERWWRTYQASQQVTAYGCLYTGPPALKSTHSPSWWCGWQDGDKGLCGVEAQVLYSCRCCTAWPSHSKPCGRRSLWHGQSWWALDRLHPSSSSGPASPLMPFLWKAGLVCLSCGMVSWLRRAPRQSWVRRRRLVKGLVAQRGALWLSGG